MLKLVVFLALCMAILAKPNQHMNDRVMHPRPKKVSQSEPSSDENTAEFWRTIGKNTVKKQLDKKTNTNVAKNVIIFMGDGMSIPTLTATRVYLGNENYELSFEKFPHTAVSKTYCLNYQVPDSACTATAYLAGIKTNLGTVGVTGNIEWSNCMDMKKTEEFVDSIAQWSQDKGKSTGFVTTTRVTHASPAGVFGHSAQRDWETDTDIINDPYIQDPTQKDPKVCMDLATQLVTQDPGKSLNVIMGGGRYAFLPKEVRGEEGDAGYRSDGVNLIDTWKNSKQNQTASYIWNRDQLLALPEDTDYVLGLFESSHCPFHLERDEDLDPTLTEMTEAAIKILSRNENGYFLFVEGGRIDMGHHQAMAHLAFEETAEFARAVERAVNITNEDDTLIVVTSDHAHTMTISGYPLRGNDILGIGDKADDGLPFTTINYANGPGYHHEVAGHRYDLTDDDMGDIEYKFGGNFYMDSETHGADDVIVFAKGPWAHLFKGVIEENVIAHVMGYASCVGDGETACDSQPSGAATMVPVVVMVVLVVVRVLV